MVRVLLNAGADPLAKDSDCWTAEHVAASWGLSKIQEHLHQACLGRGIDSSEWLNSEGYTATELHVRFLRLKQDQYRD